jgi:hypothetical protein
MGTKAKPFYYSAFFVWKNRVKTTPTDAPNAKINQKPASPGLLAILSKKTTYKQIVIISGKNVNSIPFLFFML